MNLLFIHSGEKIKRDSDGKLYTDGSYSKEVWERYLTIFSHITLIMREDKEVYSRSEAEKRFNPIISDRMNLVSIPNQGESIKTFFSRSIKEQINKTLEDQIAQADGVIIRLPGLYSAVDICLKQKKKFMVEVVGCPFDSLWNHSLKGKVLAVPEFLKFKATMKKVPYAIYVTRDFLQKRYPCKGKSINCSNVSIEKVEKYNPERNICSSNGQIVIGTAAAVGLKYKGQQYVIRAMKKLATLGYNDYVYEIAGNGNASSLVRLAEECGLSDRVIFPGSIPHDKIMDWHRHLNIYIQPSLQEGLPRALIEAMSCGTPCIGSKTGGIPELLSKDFIFQTKNPDEIANKLIMLRSPEVFRKNSIECIEKSSEYKKEVLNARRISFMSDVFLK